MTKVTICRMPASNGNIGRNIPILHTSGPCSEQLCDCHNPRISNGAGMPARGSALPHVCCGPPEA